MRDWVPRFEALVEERCGIRLSPTISERVADLLESRVAAKRMQGVGAYLDYLSSLAGTAELKELFNVLTVGKTSFYRYPEQVSGIVDHVMPALNRVLPREQGLKIWSAACSSGEEPYTISIGLQTAGWYDRRRIEILATDLNTESLERARIGRFPVGFGTEGVPALAQRFLLRQGREVVVAPEIVERVRFEQLNLIDCVYPAPGTWHVVVCANVLIYFGAATNERILTAIHAAMAPNSILFLGGAESLPPPVEGFTIVRFGNFFAFAKGDWRGELRRYEASPPQRSRAIRPDAAAAAAGHSARMKRSRADTAPLPTLKPSAAAQPAPTASPQPTVGGRIRQGLREAQRLTDAGDRPRAIEELLRLRPLDPENPDICQRLAILLFEERRFEEAVDAFEHAIVADPLAVDLYFYEGWLLRRNGQTEPAQAAFRRALFLEPDFAFARYEFASILHEAEDFDGAVREYNRAAAAAESEEIQERLLARAAIRRDPFWRNTFILLDLCNRNRKLALQKEPPTGFEDSERSSPDQ